MKKVPNLLTIVFLLTGLVATLPTAPALADCAPSTGTAADESFTCTGTDTDGLDTGGSTTTEDTVTVQSGATVSNTGDAIFTTGNLDLTNNGDLSSSTGTGVNVGGSATVANASGAAINASSNGVVINGDGT
jgi:hypothetical protein